MVTLYILRLHYETYYIVVVVKSKGIPWGSPLVEKILVLCKNDGNGNVVFSTFAEDLIM